MYLLSALMCAPGLAVDQHTQEERLEDQATALLRTEEGIEVGSIVSSVLAELHGRQRIAPLLENLPTQPNPLVTDLVRYIADFYPALMGDVPLSHRIATAPPPPALPDDFEDDDWDAQPTEGFASPPSRPVATGRPQAAAATAYAPSAQQQADSQAKRAEETALNQEATRLMRTGIEDNEIMAGFVLGVLDELNNKPARPRSRTIEIVSEIISDFLIKPNDLAMFFDVKIKKPFIERLIQYIRQFHPDLMRRMDSMSQEPQYARYPRTPQEAVARGRHVDPNALRADSDEARRLQAQFYAEDAARAARNRQAQEETDRLLAREEADREARRARLAREAQAATDALLSREEAQRREARDQEAAAGEREVQRIKAEEADRRAKYEADLPLRREREAADHAIALMHEAVGQVEQRQGLDGFGDHMESVIGLYANALEQDRQQINGAMLNMHELSFNQNSDLMNRVKAEGFIPSMDFIHEILDMQRDAREARDRIVRQRQEEQRREAERAQHEAQRLADLQLQQARDAQRLEEVQRLEEKRQAADQARVAAAVQRPGIQNAWDIESIGVDEPAIHFEMPKGLAPQEQEMVRFFMDHVNPKLIELLKAKRIDAREYNGVLRAYSMGILGFVHAEGYGEVARERKANDFRSAQEAREQNMPGFWNSLVNLDEVMKKSLKLNDVTDGTPLLAKLARKNGWNGRVITTFMTLHIEDMQSAIDKRLNNFLQGKGDDPAAALDEYARGIKERILILPGVLRDGFEALLSQGGTDSQWVEFVKACDNIVCYDGTTDPIIGKKLEQAQSLRAGAVENSFAPLVEKIKMSELNSKLPGAKHGEVPGFTDVLSREEDSAEGGEPIKVGFFPSVERALSPGLKNIIATDIDTQAKKDNIDRIYAPFRAAYFMGKTLLRIGVKADLIPAIYRQLGLRPGTTACLYSDEDILELMFWIDKQGEAAVDGQVLFLPPMVATKFGIAQ